MDRRLIIGTCTSVLIAALAGRLVADPQLDADAEPAAVAAVQMYLDALATADVPGLLRVLSRDLRREKAATVNSRGYLDLLARLYAGSTYVIEDSEPGVDGGVLVTSRMQLDDGHARTFRFVVRRQPDGSYRIAEEL